MASTLDGLARQFLWLHSRASQKKQAMVRYSREVAMLGVVTSILGDHGPENAVLIGWSAGANVAFAAEVELEACCHGVRALVELDNLLRPPHPRASA